VVESVFAVGAVALLALSPKAYQIPAVPSAGRPIPG